MTNLRPTRSHRDMRTLNQTLHCGKRRLRRVSAAVLAVLLVSFSYAPEAEAGVGSVLVQFFKQLSKVVARETDSRAVDDIFKQREELIDSAFELGNR